MRTLKWIGGFVLAVVLAAVLFFAFGMNALRGPISRAVSAATGRELLIEGELKPVWTWPHPRVRAERVSFANTGWGKADHFLKADAIEARISVLPLFIGRVVLPEVHLQRAQVSLEQDAEGRKNWILEREPEGKEQSRFFIELLILDQGRLAWDDAARDTSLRADFSADDAGVSFRAEGKYRGMALKATGHTGRALALRDQSTPFPLNADIKIGDTAATLEGTVTGLVDLKGIDLNFERLSGSSMAELYRIIGLAFPDTSPYRVSGRLVRTRGSWRFERFAGKVGESDLAGTLQVDTAKGKRPFMHGDLTAKVLNFADLAPLVGAKQPREKRVLPDAPFDAARWDSVDADVWIRAGTIKRPEQLPLDRLAARIRMRDKVLTLEPLEFGIAGGRLAGTVRLDGANAPIRGDVKMRVQNLQLAKLFPTVKQAQGSIGGLDGLIELAGSGESIGKLLGSADGKIGVYIEEGRGKDSNCAALIGQATSSSRSSASGATARRPPSRPAR